MQLCSSNGHYTTALKYRCFPFGVILINHMERVFALLRAHLQDRYMISKILISSLDIKLFATYIILKTLTTPWQDLSLC